MASDNAGELAEHRQGPREPTASENASDEDSDNPFANECTQDALWISD